LGFSFSFKESIRNRCMINELNRTFTEVAVMHILAFILIFVVGSIIAACDGDYSGIAAIGKFVGFFVLLFAVLWLFTQPVLLIIAIIVLVLIVICCSAK